MPICTQGIQRTWWPEAGTIVVTGPYWMMSHASHKCKLIGAQDPCFPMALSYTYFFNGENAWKCHHATTTGKMPIVIEVLNKFQTSSKTRRGPHGCNCNMVLSTAHHEPQIYWFHYLLCYMHLIRLRKDTHFSHLCANFGMSIEYFGESWSTVCSASKQTTADSILSHQVSFQWVSARKTQLQCVSNGVTSFLH